MVLRWGVMGAGRISADFVNALCLWIDTLDEAKAQFAGVATSSSLERAQKFVSTAVNQNFKKTDLSKVKTYGTYEAIVSDPDIDVIYIGTIHTTHKELTILSLNKGKHVLVEKPMAIHIKDAEEMVALAREKKLFFAEGMWTRFFPAIKKARELLDEDAIGEVKAVYADFGFQADFKEGGRLFELDQAGGGLLDIGCYIIAAMMMTGHNSKDDPVVETRCLGHLHEKFGVDVCGTVGLKFSSGKMGTGYYTLDCQTPEEVRYVGKKGHIIICAPAHCPSKVILVTMEGRDASGRQEVEVKFDLPSNTVNHEFLHPNSEGFFYQAEAVTEAILRGEKECKEFTLNDSLALAKICTDARKQMNLVYPIDPK